jgi:hypothetical protein
LDKFSDGWVSFFTGKKYSGIPYEVIDYLEKYWLQKVEYEKTGLPIKNTIFKGNFKSFPTIFKDDFETIVEIGGSVVNDEKYYTQMQSCMKLSGDNYFVLVQDLDENTAIDLPPSANVIDWPPARFKYPIDVSYEEILSGEFVSEERIQMGDIDYFVYGDSGNWGIYAGDDLLCPLHIIGFKKQFSELFQSHFPIPPEDVETITHWLEKDISHINKLKNNRPEIF